MALASVETVAGPVARLTAWLIGTAAVFMAGVAAAAHLMTAVSHRVPLLDTPEPVAAVAFGVVGAVVVGRRPRHPVGWVLT